MRARVRIMDIFHRLRRDRSAAALIYVTVALPVLIGITLVNFLIINLAPGDPLSIIASPDLGLSRDQLEELRLSHQDLA